MLSKIIHFRSQQSILVSSLIGVRNISAKNTQSAKETSFYKKLPRIKPPGPIKVWNVIEKKNSDGKLMKFSIQEIPEDRYEDAVQHMCTYFLAEEPTCQYSNAINDPVFVEDFRNIWHQTLKQGIAIGAFLNNPDGGKPIIAGLNILGVESKDHQGSLEDMELNSENLKKTYIVMMDLSKEARIYERYGVDKYLFAYGLSVSHDYRGYGLGTELLKARDIIGREYKIPMTSTVFTSAISAKAAENAGFELLLAKNFADLVSKDGKEYFPGINSKIIKVMAKRIS